MLPGIAGYYLVPRNTTECRSTQLAVNYVRSLRHHSLYADLKSPTIVFTASSASVRSGTAVASPKP
jgi:hypothetical protein